MGRWWGAWGSLEGGVDEDSHADEREGELGHGHGNGNGNGNGDGNGDEDGDEDEDEDEDERGAEPEIRMRNAFAPVVDSARDARVDGSRRCGDAFPCAAGGRAPSGGREDRGRRVDRKRLLALSSAGDGVRGGRAHRARARQPESPAADDRRPDPVDPAADSVGHSVARLVPPPCRAALVSAVPLRAASQRAPMEPVLVSRGRGARRRQRRRRRGRGRSDSDDRFRLRLRFRHRTPTPTSQKRTRTRTRTRSRARSRPRGLW